MKITTLVENTSIEENVGSEHGLSLHIETSDLHLLLDSGQGELFFHNANVLGIDINEVDYLVLSHAHSDHGGGFETFLERNEAGRILVRETAFEKYYSLHKEEDPSYIGLDQALSSHERIDLIPQEHTIAPGIRLFSAVTPQDSRPSTNYGLLIKVSGELREDDFHHEQYLVIEEDDKTVLITGCSHNGIVNIVRAAEEFLGQTPDVVLGGFHLSNPYWETSEDEATIDSIAEYLLRTGAKYYTGHCTGQAAYDRLKQTMGERVDYLAGGSVIDI